MKFIKKHIKLIIVLLIVAIGVTVYFVYQDKKKKAEALAMMDSGFDTQTVTRQTVSNYVSLTGTIKANDSRTVYSSINEVEVLSVNVKVGDYVNKGDVVAVLDSSSLEDKLATAKRSLANTQQKTALSLAKAQKGVNEALEDAVYGVRDANKDIERAGRDYGYTEGDKDNAWQDWQDALEDYEDAKEDYERAHKQYKRLKKNADKIQYGGVTYYYDSESEGATEDSKTRKDLKTLVDSLEDARDKAEDAATSAERAYTSKVQGLEKEYRSYDDAETKKEDKNRENGRKLEDAQISLQEAQLNAANSTDELNDQIKDYEKRIEKCQVKAPISGVVTSVKMEAGDETANDKNVICVINDTSCYKVEGTVDEYDIYKLSEGMSAVIKTEATGDYEMKGKVTFVSPTPESSSDSSNSGSGSSGSSSSAAYPVEVLIGFLDEKARIGMTAQTNILTQTADDVLTVPYDCITQNADGDFVVYAKTGKEADSTEAESGEDSSDKGRGMRMGGPPRPGMGGDSDDGNDISKIKAIGKEIKVDKILEADYYTAVRGEGLREGMEVYEIPSSDYDDSAGAGDIMF